MDSMEVRALTARASNAERRVVNLQNQLLAAEERLTSVNQKTTVADNKWEVRVKEYETRLKQAEEKVKRERQGGKERALELETQIKYVRRCPMSFYVVDCADTVFHRRYQRQIDIAQKRISQLNDIIDGAGLDRKSVSPSRQ